MAKPLDSSLPDEAQIDALLDDLPVATFRVGLDGVIRYANPAAEALLNLRRSDLAGRRYDQPPVRIETLEGQPLAFDESPVPRALRGEKVSGFEAVLWLPEQDEPRILCFDASPLRGGDGEIAGVLVSGKDVTEQHHAREALRFSERRLSSVLNNTTMAVFVMDERQQCTFANAAAEQLTGYSIEEMQGRPLHDVIHHTHPDGRPYPLEDCPIDRAFPENNQTQGEEVFVHRDGSFYPVAFTASPIRDEASKIVGTVIEARGIADEKRRESERREAQIRVRESEQRLSALMDVAPSFIWFGGPDGDIRFLNERWYAYTGQTPEEAVGAGWSAVVHPDDAGATAEKWRAATAAGASYETELRYRGRDGEYRWFMARAEPLKDVDGSVVGWVGASTDIHELKAADEALRQTEERYRLALSATQDTIWDWDLQADQVLWNDALRSTHGHDLPERASTGEWWLEHIHPDDRRRVHDSIHAVIDGDAAIWLEEYRFLRADGAYAEVLDRGRVLRDEQGRAVRMIGAMLDQTEQKRQQAALRESEATLRSLTEAMPNMAWTTRADGAVEWFNARWYEYVGSEPGSDLGHAWIEYLHPDDRDGAVEAWTAAAAAGVEFSNEHRFRGADGSYRWFLARGVPIKGAGSALTRWFGTCTDIQDLVEARNLLTRSREELAHEVEERTRELNRLWSISEDLFVVFGRDGVCRNANPAWTTALGYPSHEVVGRPLEVFVVPQDRGRYHQALAALIETGSVRDVDLRLCAKDGSHRAYVWNCDLEGDDFYGSGRDITRRTELENQLRQAQKMETVGKLTGGVAHDFNNLLQVISGNLQLLSKDVAGNLRAETRVQNALAGVSRGSKLASQLLAFGRRQPLEPKVVGVGRLISGMEDMLRRSLGEAVEVETVISGGLWNTMIDPVQLENALLNLAINARDAMDGSGKLTIEAGNAYLDDAYARTHTEVTPGQYVVVAVTDTGCGMTADVLAQVFEPFFSTKPEGKGTGLGLSMVYGFVKQSGGHVKIYSEVGQGTTVKLYLPRSTADEDVAVATDTGPMRGGTETILVAEDDEDVRTTAVEMLTSLGYRVLKAKDAASALSIIESGIPIDLLFTDVVMPGQLRSPELARKAKERLPNIAVLFTSGYTENAIVHGGRLDPGVELLGKPYTQEALARKVRHVLANQQQRNQALAPKSTAPVMSMQAPAMGRSTVLLVEDDELIRSNTAEMLQELGQIVVDVATGEEALLALQTTPIDILITDLGLPGMRGDLLAAKARELRPDIGVVFASGTDDLDAKDGAVLLRKPYDLTQLEQVLRSLLRTHASSSVETRDA